jgi:hypothetical protein
MSTIAVIDEFIPVVTAANAMQTLSNRVGITRFINTDFAPELASEGDVLNIPFYAEAGTARTKTAGNDFVPDTTTATKKTITLVHKYKEIPLDKNQVAAAKSTSLIEGHAFNAIKSVLEAIDLEVYGLTATITNTANETSNHYSDLVKGKTSLIENKAPADAVFTYAVSPTKHEDLLLDDQISKILNFGGNVAQTGIIPQVSGVGLFQSQLVYTGGSPVRKHNTLFHRDAFGIAYRPMTAVNSGEVLKQGVYNDPSTSVSILLSVGFREKENNFFVRAEALFGVTVLRNELAYVIKEA